MKIKRQRRTRNDSGRIVRLFPDMEQFIGESLLSEIHELYNKGHTPEEIGKATGWQPDEIFLVLVHLAREGFELREFAKRI